MDVSERSRTALVKFSVVMLLRNFVHAFIIIYRCSLVQPVFVVSVLYARLEVQRLDLDGVLSNPDLTVLPVPYGWMSRKDLVLRL